MRFRFYDLANFSEEGEYIFDRPTHSCHRYTGYNSETGDESIGHFLDRLISTSSSGTISFTVTSCRAYQLSEENLEMILEEFGLAPF